MTGNPLNTEYNLALTFSLSKKEKKIPKNVFVNGNDCHTFFLTFFLYLMAI